MSRIRIENLTTIRALSICERHHTLGGIVPFWMKVAAGAGVGLYTGGPVGAAFGAAGVIVGNHAAKRWTGNGLKNWRNPRRW